MESLSTKRYPLGNLKREDLCIVYKLASPFHRKEHVPIGLQKNLTDLRLDYLDLYLMHWPQAFYYDETGLDGVGQLVAPYDCVAK